MDMKATFQTGYTSNMKLFVLVLHF